MERKYWFIYISVCTLVFCLALNFSLNLTDNVVENLIRAGASWLVFALLIWMAALIKIDKPFLDEDQSEFFPGLAIKFQVDFIRQFYRNIANQGKIFTVTVKGVEFQVLLSPDIEHQTNQLEVWQLTIKKDKPKKFFDVRNRVKLECDYYVASPSGYISQSRELILTLKPGQSFAIAFCGDLTAYVSDR